MKKKYIILLIVIAIIVMLIPIPKKDNDTKEYKAILYYIKISPNEKTIKILGFSLKNNEEKKDLTIKTIDEFYNKEITKGYLDLRKIPKEYKLEDAIKDKYFTITDEEVFNDSQYPEFLENYENKKTCFLRTVIFNDANDAIIYDIIYDKDTDSLYIIPDFTRDSYSSIPELELLHFEKMANYTYQYHTYWVLYNGELTDQSLFGENTLIISYV